MANNSSLLSKNDTASCVMSSPKKSTVNFIRQFARTCITIQGSAMGAIILN